MFVATNRLRVKKDHGGELEQRFGQPGEVGNQPGFMSFELWKLDADEDFEEYLVVTHWDSEEAHNAWTRSEAFKQAHSGPRMDSILGHPESKQYDIRLCADVTEEKASA